VVSIKPHEDEGMSRIGIAFYTRPDGLSFKGGSLDMLLRFAFDVSRDRLLNEPEWAMSSRFDIEAKVGPDDAIALKPLTREQRWAMLVPTLQDRCALKFHHEKRNLQVYALVVARGGSKLKKAAVTDSSAVKLGSTTQTAQEPMMTISDKGLTIWAHHATLESLVAMLSQQVGATVVDNTGLLGKYDYTLSWMPNEDSFHLMGLPIPGPLPERAGQTQAIGPSIFSALQEQLGLRLERHKEPVDVIVIDHLERPSAD
jgi:uncharacterized protein (TIGR03435 family)